MGWPHKNPLILLIFVMECYFIAFEKRCFKGFPLYLQDICIVYGSMKKHETIFLLLSQNWSLIQYLFHINNNFQTKFGTDMSKGQRVYSSNFIFLNQFHLEWSLKWKISSFIFILNSFSNQISIKIYSALNLIIKQLRVKFRCNFLIDFWARVLTNLVQEFTNWQFDTITYN